MSELKGKPRQVLIDAANGMPSKVIAGKHGVTESTVEAQLKVARDVLGARNTPQAIARALKLGIIKPFEIAVLAMLCLGGINDGQLRVKRAQPRAPTVRIYKREVPSA